MAGGGVCGRGRAWQGVACVAEGGMHGGGVSGTHATPCQIDLLRDTVNERAVRILLELETVCDVMLSTD